MTGTLHSEIDKGIVHIILDNPGRKNALSLSLLQDICKAIPAAAAAGGRVIILTGANDVFSAGADLADIQGTSVDAAYDRELENAIRAIQAFPGPVIAVLSGPCMGAAVDLALSCDIRICDTDAFIEVPAIRLGLLYNPRSVARLHRKFPSSVLTRIFLLGERFTAESALQAGLIAQRYASRDDVITAAENLARNAAGVSQGAAALTKELLVTLDRGEADLAKWEKLQMEILDSPDRKVAVASARERLGIGNTAAGSDAKSTKARGAK